MRILITGNMGYVGPVVVAHLREEWPDAELIGYDAGFFARNLIGGDTLPEQLLTRQEFGDVRDLPARLLDGVDMVVHLAAISNDPMGLRFEEATHAINQLASIRLAELAAAAGVSHFVFASSCSVYGFAAGHARREEDELNPLTAYARSKIGTEQALSSLSGRSDMIVTCLRFATACGMSPRLRLDLVLNDFVASALLTGEIKVLSDGTPWRPLIDVADMARAIGWAGTRDRSAGGAFLAINAGSDDGNYQVATLAEAVAQAVTHTAISINRDAPPDRRSYQVDFGMFRALAPDHQPRVDLATSIDRIRRGILAAGAVSEPALRAATTRLRSLDEHLAAGRLDGDLRWSRPDRSAARIAAPAQVAAL
jgi:nucleoside-diphosphate-sugar epimerase